MPGVKDDGELDEDEYLGTKVKVIEEEPEVEWSHVIIDAEKFEGDKFLVEKELKTGYL